MSGNYLRRVLASVTLCLACATTLWAQGSSSLDAVVVTASSVNESKRELTTNATILTEKDISRSTAKNLAELMRQNGFQTYSPGDGVMAQRPYVRGFGASSMGNNEMNYPVLTLLNGHRTGSADVALINLENIERIEILRGPAAVQYGPSAMGGVINVITKRGQEGIAGKAELGFGSFGRFDQKLSLSGAGGGFDFSLGVTNSSRNDYKTGDGVTWPNSEYDQKTGLDLDVGYTFLERHRLSAHLNYNLAKGDATPSGFSDTWNFPDNVTVYDNSSYNATIMYEGGTDNELLNWKAAYTFGRTTSNSVGYIEDDPNNPLVINWYLFGPFYPEANTVYNTRINFHQAQAQLSFDNGFLALIGGFDHVRYRGSSESLGFDIGYSWTTYGRDKAEDTAGYLLAKVRPFGDESLILSAAGRYDSYEVSTEGFKSAEKSFTPSVGVAWSPLDWLKLRAHYAEGFIVPTPANLFGDTYYLPNLDVKPAKSKTWEVGVDVAWNYVDASLTYFHTNYKDKIVTVMVSPAVNGKTRIYDNLDAAIIAGLELSLGVDLGAALQQDFMLRPYASLTYLTTRENKNRNRRTDFVTQAPDLLPDTPKLTAAFGLTFEHPGINLASTLSAAYMGRRYTMDFSAAHAVAGGYFDNPWVETGGFTVWNLSLEKRLWGFEDRGSLGLRVELNNIFDKDYAYSLDYPLPGRNFYVGLSIEY